MNDRKEFSSNIAASSCKKITKYWNQISPVDKSIYKNYARKLFIDKYALIEKLHNKFYLSVGMRTSSQISPETDNVKNVCYQRSYCYSHVDTPICKIIGNLENQIYKTYSTMKEQLKEE